MFLVRFMRSQKPARGYLVGVLALAGVSYFGWKGMVPLSRSAYVPFIVLVSFIFLLPYLYDRLLAPKLPGFASTWVLPLSRTALDYLISLVSPFGTIASPAYTQSGFLPLLQIVSVTGMWGVTFLIFWFAAVVNWAWEEGFEWRRIRRGVALWAGTLTLVLLLGQLRLALFRPTSSTVRVVAITAFDARASRLPEEGAALREASARIREDYLARSEREALAGAQIVCWPEVAVPVTREDEGRLIERGRALARRDGIYLLMSLHTLGNPGEQSDNKMVLAGPSGPILWDYLKTKTFPDPDRPGDGKIPTAETPRGKLAGAICLDMDFPGLIRQAGQKRADILLAPYLDWRAIAPLHARIAVFRAIENGVSLVRPASNGLSLAVDYQGRVLAAMDHFAARDRVLRAQIPTRGVATVYSRVGDLFAWLCVGGFLFILVHARRRH